MTFYKESTILLIINSLKRIINIFLGPFLTAYFIKISINSINSISVYYIFSYLLLGISGLFIGYLVQQKLKTIVFRVGVILNFIYILFIVLLRDSIVNNLPLLSFLFGISTVCYWYPFNLFGAEKVSNEERKSFEFKKQALSNIISMTAPILLGGIITTSSFTITATIVLFISLIQVLLSFFITPTENSDTDFKLRDTYKELIKDSNVRNLLITEFFRGMNVSDGALEVLLTMLIFNAFKTDLNLGIISSIAFIVIIVFQYVYTNLIDKKEEKYVIAICSIVPIFCLLILLLIRNNFTLMLYYFFYCALVNVLTLIVTIRLFTTANDPVVLKNNQLEFWSIREFVLNLGRVFSYFLLFLIGLTKNFEFLYYLMIVLTLSIAVMSYFLTKIKIPDLQNEE